MIKVYVFSGKVKIGEGTIDGLFIKWFRYDSGINQTDRVGDNFLRTYRLEERL